MTAGTGQRALSSREARLEAMLADAQEQLLGRDDAIRSLRSDEFAQLNDVIARQGEAIRWLEALVEHRDHEIEWLRRVVAEKDKEATWLHETLDRESARLEEIAQNLDAVQATRLWRLGQRYWRLRERLRRRRIRPR
jgi:hypothetical protein